MIEIYKDGTFVKMCPVIELTVNELLKKYQDCVWYQYYISLAEHRMVGKYQFGTTGIIN